MVVKVSREIANDIDFLKDKSAFEDIVSLHMNKKWSTEYSSSFRELDIETLCDILINGYEIEETPEEKLLDEFNNAIQTANRKTPFTYDDGYWTGFKDGIYQTLEIKKEKIKGIND